MTKGSTETKQHCVGVFLSETTFKLKEVQVFVDNKRQTLDFHTLCLSVTWFYLSDFIMFPAQDHCQSVNDG